jgi:hypothetical protein
MQDNTGPGQPVLPRPWSGTRRGTPSSRIEGWQAFREAHAELENIKIILYRIADAVEGGSIDARRGAVLVQVYNAIRGCIEDQRRIRELEDVITRLVKKLTGTAPHPAGPGMADIKRTARGYEGQQPESVLRHRQAVG